MVGNQEALIARVLDLFAQRFPKQAVLRGGMVLRVLGSPRLTNGLDYLFFPFRSKKDIAEEVVGCLESIEGASISYSLNSKCLRAVLTVDGVTVQVEAKVAMSASTSMASTRLVGQPFGLPPRMVLVAEHSVALANKLAAWNERRLVRDIYDAWFFLQMGILPDEKTITQRLVKPIYSRLVKPADRFRGEASLPEFYEFLRQCVSQISDADIAGELVDYLPPDELVGLAMQFRSAFVRLR
jgi:hypothetical protein